jgi:hypothetical protein
MPTPEAVLAIARRRRVHEPSLQDGSPCRCQPPGTVCRATMKGPVGTEDSSDRMRNVDKDQGN